MIHINLAYLSQVSGQLNKFSTFTWKLAHFPERQGSWPIEIYDFMTVMFLTVQQAPHLSLQMLAFDDCSGIPLWVTVHYLPGVYSLLRACVLELARFADSTSLCLSSHLCFPHHNKYLR